MPAAGQRHTDLRSACRRGGDRRRSRERPYYIQHLVAATRNPGLTPKSLPTRTVDRIVPMRSTIRTTLGSAPLRDRLPHYYGAMPLGSPGCSTSMRTDQPLGVDAVLMRLRSEGSPIATARSWCPSSNDWLSTTTSFDRRHRQVRLAADSARMGRCAGERASRLFTPSAMPAEELEALTVGRTQLLDTLTNASGPPPGGSRPTPCWSAPRRRQDTYPARRGRTARSPRPRPRKRTPRDDSRGFPGDRLLPRLPGRDRRGVGPELAETARGLRRERDPVGIEAADQRRGG